MSTHDRMFHPLRPQLFSLGKVVITTNAAHSLAPEEALQVLRRHVKGDWGDLCDEDRRTNEDALRTGQRLFSSYAKGMTQKVWVITEADRSYTTILLPEDY